MTVDKSQTIKIPIWLVSIMLPLIVTAIGVYGLTTAFKAETQTEIKQLKQSQDRKIDRTEFDLILKSLDKFDKSLDRIDAKLDKHIDKHNDR